MSLWGDPGPVSPVKIHRTSAGQLVGAAAEAGSDPGLGGAAETRGRCRGEQPPGPAAACPAACRPEQCSGAEPVRVLARVFKSPGGTKLGAQGSGLVSFPGVARPPPRRHQLSPPPGVRVPTRLAGDSACLPDGRVRSCHFRVPSYTRHEGRGSEMLAFPMTMEVTAVLMNENSRSAQHWQTVRVGTRTEKPCTSCGSWSVGNVVEQDVLAVSLRPFE